MQGVELLRILRAEHSVVLVTVYRFMLGSVVLEQRLYIIHVAYRRNIADKHQDPEYSFNQVEHDRAFYPLAQEVNDPGRQNDEKDERDRHREEQGSCHQEIPCGLFAELLIDPCLNLSGLLGILLRSVSLEDIRGLHQGSHASDERVNKGNDTPDERDLERLALFLLELRLEVELTRRQAHSKRDPVRALHHDAFHHSLPANRSRAGAFYENFIVVNFSHSCIVYYAVQIAAVERVSRILPAAPIERTRRG